MKKVLLIVIVVFLPMERGRAANQPEMKIVCPSPHLVASHLKSVDIARNLHGYLVHHRQSEVGEVYIPEMTLDVRSYHNAKGYLICAYHDRRMRSNAPLLYIRMNKTIPLENIERKPAELQKPKS